MSEEELPKDLWMPEGRLRVHKRGRRCRCGRVLAQSNPGPDCYNCKILATLRKHREKEEKEEIGEQSP